MESLGAGGMLALKYCSAGKAATFMGVAMTAPDMAHDSARPLFDTARNMSEQMVNSIMKMEPIVEEASGEHAHVNVAQEPVVAEATGEHAHVNLAQGPLSETAPPAETIPDHPPVQTSNAGILLSSASPVLPRYDRYGATSGAEAATLSKEAPAKIVKDKVANQGEPQGTGSNMRAPADRDVGFIFVKDRLELASASNSGGDSHHRAHRRCCLDVTLQG